MSPSPSPDQRSSDSEPCGSPIVPETRDVGSTNSADTGTLPTIPPGPPGADPKVGMSDSASFAAEAPPDGLPATCLAPELDQRPRDAAVVAAALAAFKASVQKRLRQAELDRTRAQVAAVEELKRRRQGRRQVLLATDLVFIMTGITGWVVYGKTSQVLTNLELQRLRDNTCKIGHALNDEIRVLRSDTWGLAQRGGDRSVANRLFQALRGKIGSRPEELTAELSDSFRKLLKDRPYYLQACFLYRQAGQDQPILLLERQPDGTVKDRPAGPARTHRGDTDQFGLGIKLPQRLIDHVIQQVDGDGTAGPRVVIRASCAAYESKADMPCGVVVLTMDLGARLNKSPERLAFLTDETGKLLATPGPFCFPGPSGAADIRDTFRVSAERRPDPDQTLDPDKNDPKLWLEKQGRLYRSVRIAGQAPFYLKSAEVADNVNAEAFSAALADLVKSRPPAAGQRDRGARRGASTRQ